MTTGGYGHSQAISFQAQRLALFRDYEEMDSDAIISSALDVYSDESTMKNEYGKILEINSEDENIHDILHNLFYDILNIEFNLWPWVRNLCKYGDFYLYLDIKEKYGITNVIPLSAYDVTRIEGEDPENPYYVQFMVEEGVTLHNVPRDRIDVIGGPQYELYRELGPTLNIESFRHRLNIPDHSQVVTFTAEAIEGTPDEPYFVDVFNCT